MSAARNATQNIGCCVVLCWAYVAVTYTNDCRLQVLFSSSNPVMQTTRTNRSLVPASYSSSYMYIHVVS